MLGCAISGCATSNGTLPRHEEAYLAVLQLNYCQESLSRCVSYNNRVILDQEYRTIVSNLNLASIPDYELVELRRSLLGLLNELSISEQERERLKARYERKVKTSFRESLTTALSRVGRNPLSAWTAITNTALSLGSVYFEYQKNVDQYKDALDDARWELKKDELRKLTELREDTLETAWKMIKSYDLPDELRVTEEQLTRFVEIGKDGDVARRVRRLEYVQDQFRAYPPFWYYLGHAYKEARRNDDALAAYGRFDELHRPVFRCDPHAAAVSLDRLAIRGGDLPRSRVRRELERIRRNAPYDAPSLLFTASQYVCLLSDVANAKRILQHCVDERIEPTTAGRLLGDLLAGKRDWKGLAQLARETMKVRSEHMFDVLYLVGSARDADILNEVRDKVVAVDVQIVDPMLGRRWLRIGIPNTWVPDGFEMNVRLGDLKEYSAKFKENDAKSGKSVYEVPWKWDDLIEERLHEAQQDLPDWSEEEFRRALEESIRIDVVVSEFGEEVVVRFSPTRALTDKAKKGVLELESVRTRGIWFDITEDGDFVRRSERL